MFKHFGTVLLCGVVTAGCARPGQPAEETVEPVRAEQVAAPLPDTAHATHGEHAAGPVMAAGMDHAGHTPAAAASVDHGAHPAGAARHEPAALGAHQHHAAREVDTARAGQHAQVHGDTAHARHHAAMHGDTAHADTSHMVHGGHHTAMPRDTAHAGHHPDPAADTANAAHAHAHATVEPHTGAPHEMWMRSLGGGWMGMGMAQVFPVVTSGAPDSPQSPLSRTAFYLTQPAAMLNLESPGSRWSVRVTPNFEGLTIPDGELTFGGWGEGFIDNRHPHTLLHEAMLSYNAWEFAGGALSISAGKGFAPFGTDDPMSRPVLKYPTNHHLSQILERWTVNGVYLLRNWSVEAGIFGGAEPTTPYDFSNIRSFGDSWSTRVTRRFGEGFGPLAPWEVSASYAMVREELHGVGGDDHGVKQSTFLTNAAVRYAGSYGFGTLYGLVEASRSRPEEGDGYFSVLGETLLGIGRHQPYARVEYATRPEFAREGAPGTEGFFRYDHDDAEVGATRWLISSLGYGYTLTQYPFSARPFVEVQHNRVWDERGPVSIQPEQLFGTNSFWSLSAGFRFFLGGGPMRMGAYGVLDPMTVMHREMGMHGTPEPGGHH